MRTLRLPAKPSSSTLIAPREPAIVPSSTTVHSGEATCVPSWPLEFDFGDRADAEPDDRLDVGGHAAVGGEQEDFFDRLAERDLDLDDARVVRACGLVGGAEQRELVDRRDDERRRRDRVETGGRNARD